ncbi:hypothetical protein D3C80_861390 [compost metagenome]
MPAKGAERTGETPAYGTCGVDADQVEALCALADLFEDLGTVRQRLLLHKLAVPAVGVQLQVRVWRHQRQYFTQLLQAFGQALAVQVVFTAEGQLQVGLPAVMDQFQGGHGLLHLPGLAHLGVVETDELRAFGVVRQRELFSSGNGVAQPIGQCLEGVDAIEDRRHQASPPNTSIWLNTQAGEAWPTRTTWLGSPFPQLGVPRTWKVLASPTALRLRQKCAEMPR